MNGSLYPWAAPLVFALLSGTFLAIGNYIPAIVCAVIAVAVRLLHQRSLDAGYDDF